MKIVKILAILIAAAGLLLCVAEPIMGIVFIVIGIAIFFLSGRKKPEPAQPEPVDISVQERHAKYITLAGFDYYQNELSSLLDEPNEEYSYSTKKMAEEFLGRVYQYETAYKFAQLVPEPENEFDANAIAVYVDDMKIGYIPKKNQADVAGIEFGEVEIYGGKYKEVNDDGYGPEMETGETPYKAELSVEMK